MWTMTPKFTCILPLMLPNFAFITYLFHIWNWDCMQLLLSLYVYQNVGEYLADLITLKNDVSTENTPVHSTWHIPEPSGSDIK